MRFETRILQHLFPSVLFTVKGGGIYLTFDDGPHPTGTPELLKILRIRGIRASFFLTGQNVRKYSDLTLQIKSEGHQIGNHSYSHTNLFFMKKENVRKEILQTEEILETTTHEASHFFRPPYGYFNLQTLKVLRELNLTCVIWSFDSKDYLPHDKGIIKRKTLRHATNGSILLFHNNESTVSVQHTYLPELLDALLEKGFVFNRLQL